MTDVTGWDGREGVQIPPQKGSVIGTTEVGTNGASAFSYEFLWIRRTRDYIRLNVHYCVLFSSIVIVRIGVGLDLVFDWLVILHP